MYLNRSLAQFHCSRFNYSEGIYTLAMMGAQFHLLNR
nr:MAG TPA: hypothetical protein [Caudoviricetes sp.]